MRFVLACWGSRGDIEPFVAVGRELLRRGHDVAMAVPPDLVGFAEAAGPAAVGVGPDAQAVLDAHREFWTCLFRSPWRIGDLVRSRRAVAEPIIRCWQEMGATLRSLAGNADLLFTGVNFEDAAANVAEYYDIPLATLHYFPLRPNRELLPLLPGPLARSVVAAFWWLSWRGTKKVEDAQRRELGLPKAAGPAPRRITESGALEIQAYDQVCYPGLAAEWARSDGRRPFVGTLTLELATDADEQTVAWIADGTPPIFFGFGSIPLASAGETIAMIGGVCATLGVRALVSAGGTDFGGITRPDQVKIVGTVNFAAAFPGCRAVVHHGGAGTTAAGLRAGVPTLILWTDLDQSRWGAVVRRLEVGAARRFSATTEKSLVADLRRILDPRYAVRAREVAAQMTTPADGVAAAAGLVEDLARRGRG